MTDKIVFYPNLIYSVGFTKSSEPSIIGQGFSASGGETSGGVYDLVDSRRTSVVTVDTDGETDDFQIDFDLSSQITADFMIVDNHNLNTAGTEITVRFGAGDTSISVTSCYSGTLGSSLSSESTGTAIEISNDGILLMKFADSNSAYWNLLVSDIETFSADVTAGEWVIGKSFSPSTAPDHIDLVKNYDGIIVNKTMGGQKISKKRYDERKRWTLKWQYVNSSDKDNFETLFETIEGQRYPFYVDLGESAYPVLYFVRLVENSISIKRLTSNAYEVSFSIESEV